ncbi:alpha/beta fold hydrolase [Pacificimonas sp. ICDLI1SI03]
MTERPSSTVSSHSDRDLDLDILASTYRTVSDSSAFEHMVAAWGRKLEAAGSPDGDLEVDPALRHQIDGVRSLFSSALPPDPEDPLDRAVNLVSAPAMVLSPRGVLVLQNEAARGAFGLKQGRGSGREWLDPSSVADYDSVCRSVLIGGNRQHAIIRTVDRNGRRGMAELYVQMHDEGRQAYLVVRSLDLEWSDAVATVLSQAFDLTRAEIEITQLLFATRDTAQIAERRGASVHTVRTQLKTIFHKTDTASQVDLVRLVAMLCARADLGKRGTKSAWRDALGHEVILTRADGRRLAYSWMGVEGGRPALIVHGMTVGYLLAETVMQRLADENIQLFAIQRPGSGNSDSDPDSDPQEEQCEAIRFLIEELGIRGATGIGLTGSGATLIELATRDAGLFGSILTAGYILPMTPERVSRMALIQRTMLASARRAPWITQIIAQAGIRSIERHGVDWYLERAYAESPVDLEVFRNPELTPLLRNACALTTTQGHQSFVRDLQRTWNDVADHVHMLTTPTHCLFGSKDRSFSQQEIDGFVAKSPAMTAEIVPGAGELLIYQQPDLLAQRIVEAAERATSEPAAV